MDIFKIGIIGIITSLLCLIIKKSNPEIAIACGALGCTLMLIPSVGYIMSVFEAISLMADASGIKLSYIKLVFKITGIACIGEFSASLCRDAGQTALASNVELCAKVLILAMGLPIIQSLLQIITALTEGLP